MGRSRTILPLALFLALAAGCSRPVSSENFILAQNAPEGIYSFGLDLSDSLCTYDIYFYTRGLKPAESAAVALDVAWFGPRGTEFRETVWLDPRNEVSLYRSGVKPCEYGEWRLEVKPGSVPEGFAGLGTVCKRITD